MIRLGVLRSEFTKLRSLRSTVWTLLVALALMVGIGAALARVSADQYATLADAHAHGFAAVSVSLNGVALAQLAIGVLGVLAVSAEYGTGMIRATLTVVPNRQRGGRRRGRQRVGRDPGTGARLRRRGERRSG